MNYGEKIVKGSTLIFIMYFVGGAIGYFLRLFLARNLALEEFGLFYAVLSFAGFLVLFKDPGIFAAMTRFIALFKAKNDMPSVKSVIYSAIALQLVFAAVITVAVFILAPYLSEHYFKAQAAETPLRLIMLSYFFSVFVSLQFVLQGLGRIGYYSIIEPLRNAITLLLVMVFISSGVVGVAYAYLFGTIALSVIIFLLVLKSFPFFSVKGGLDTDIAKEIVAFSIPVFFTGLGGTLLGYTDTIMITYFLSAADVGLYQVALPTSQLIWIMLGSVSIVLFPVVTEMWAKKDTQMISRTLGLLVKFLFIISIPFVITITAFPEIIIRLLFSEQYLGASTALQLLAVNSVFYAVFAILSTAILGIGKPEVNMKIIAAIGTANILLNAALIPAIGIAGAAIATLASYFIGALLSIIYLSKKSFLEIYSHDIVKAFFCGAAAFAVIIFSKSMLVMDPWHEAVIALTAGAASYAALLYLTRTIKKDELMVLKKGGIPVPEFLLKFF